MSLKSVMSQTLNLIFPRKCVACKALIPYGSGFYRDVCDDCKVKLPLIRGKACSLCGRETRLCCCTGQAMQFSRLCAPFMYDGICKDMIRRFKFYKHPEHAVFFARITADVIQKEYGGLSFDLLVYVPLSKERLAQRGYDQTECLTANLSKILRIPYSKTALVKTVDNQTQHTLDKEARALNVLGVYMADKSLVKDKRILLIDDISTTGATLNECAKTLKLAGALSVHAAAIALTP